MLGIIQSAGVLTLHTHNPRYKTHNDRLATLIKLRRRDIFAALMSNCLVWHTGQSTDYTKLDIEPFSVPLSQFEFHYAGHLYHHAIDVKEARFGNVVDMYFEDFVNNHDHALKLLDLKLNVLKTHNQSVKKLVQNKSPYNYRDIVLNYKELLEYFTWMQCQDITTLNLVNPFNQPIRRSQKKQIFS